jgi:hypothetical protein
MPAIVALLRQAAGAQQARAQGPPTDLDRQQLLALLLARNACVSIGAVQGSTAAQPPQAAPFAGSGAWQHPAGGPPHAAPPQQQPAAAASGIEALLARLASGQPVLQQHQPAYSAYQAPQPTQQQQLHLSPAVQQLRQLQQLYLSQKQQGREQAPPRQAPQQQLPQPRTLVPEQVALLRLQHIASQLGYSLGPSGLAAPPGSATQPTQQWQG